MDIFRGLEEYKKEYFIHKYFPNGVDELTAKYILYALGADLSLINVALFEDMSETGLRRCLNSLPFDLYSLRRDVKDIIVSYCLMQIP